jgi:hypothetical protein
MLTRLAQIMLFAHGVQCLVGRQAAIQAAPGSITSKRTAADPGSLHQATTATASRFHHRRLDLDRKEDAGLKRRRRRQLLLTLPEHPEPADAQACDS